MPQVPNPLQDFAQLVQVEVEQHDSGQASFVPALHAIEEDGGVTLNPE